jgi:hypothetical protein
VDAAAADLRMQQMLATLGPSELRYAADVVVSRTGPANERVLGAYAVSQSLCRLPPRSEARRAAFDAAEKIVTQEFTSARAGAHTAEEVENAQAKAFGVMNVDALAECAARDAEARDELIRLGSLAKDSTIQKEILDRVRKLPPL